MSKVERERCRQFTKYTYISFHISQQIEEQISLNIFENPKVALQFVEYFEKFLGVKNDDVAPQKNCTLVTKEPKSSQKFFLQNCIISSYVAT